MQHAQEKCEQNFSHERENVEDLGTDGRITLKWILKRENQRVWTGCIRPRIGTSH
jgi:hypothetical protein